MPDFKVASFNVENLFSRARALNKETTGETTAILKKVDEFQGLIRKAAYSAADKARIFQLYGGDVDGVALKDYIEVRENRGKLFKRSGTAAVSVHAETNGSADWDGSVEFKREKFTEVTRQNTAKVVKDVNADLLCVVEVESRPTLVDFDSQLLAGRYRYEMLIDGNDDRGIDVGLLSKQEIGTIRTHMFDPGATGGRVFARDCLEVEVLLPGGKRLVVLCNHFTSKLNGGGGDRRRAQSSRVREILGKYDLTNEWVVVAGDFNDTPDSAALAPLLSDAPGQPSRLHDVLKLQFPAAPRKRWTYNSTRFEQIDFVLVSEALKSRFKRAGVFRTGMHDLEKLTSSTGAVAAGIDKEKQYPTVTRWSNAASDHGAVWAEFDLTD